jgi:uncharacterized protein YegP (UPF0339 family)
MEAAYGCRIEERERMMDYVENHDDELAEIDLTEDEIDAMMAAAEPAEIVGPPPSFQGIHFELITLGARRYSWRLSSSSGEVLATGGVYATKQAALRAVGAIKRATADAVLVDQTAS